MCLLTVLSIRYPQGAAHNHCLLIREEFTHQVLGQDRMVLCLDLLMQATNSVQK